MNQFRCIRAFESFTPQKDRPTPTEIQAWVKKHKHDVDVCFIDEMWKVSWETYARINKHTGKLWSQDYETCVEFLKTRFSETLLEPEYYICMLVLYRHIEKESLYVDFKNSPQYKRMLSGKKKGISIAGMKNTVKNPMSTVKIHPFSGVFQEV